VTTSSPTSSNASPFRSIPDAVSRPTARARTTRLGRGVLMGGIALLVLGLLKDGVWLQLMGALLVGARIAGVALDPSRQVSVRVQLHQPTRVTVADAVETVVTVTNPQSRRLPSVLVHLTTPQLSDVTVSTGAIPAGETTTLTVARTAAHRGLIAGHGVEVVTTDWFGFSRRVRTLVLTGAPAFVRPAVLTQTWRSEAPHAGAGVGARADRSGVEILAVREWQHGDQMRHVHWRSSARRGQVMVTTRSEPMEDHCCLVVAGLTGQRLTDTLAGRVAGAALSDLRAGRPVSLFAAQPGLPPLHYATAEDILDWCAQIDAPALPSAGDWAEVAARVPTGTRVVLVVDAPASPAVAAAVADHADRVGLSVEWAR
jgi:uncharacterized protein (DUF58 family)